MNPKASVQPVPGAQVPTVDFTTVDRIWIKVMHLPTAGMGIDQHSDPIDHATLVAAGSVRVWSGDKRPVDYQAPAIIEIPARTAHSFQSLEPNTVLCCIGDAQRLMAALGEIHETGLVPVAAAAALEAEYQEGY